MSQLFTEIEKSVLDIKKASDINSEAISNLHSIALSREEFLSIGKTEIANFLIKMEDLVLKEWKGEGTFYCWYDDMAGHLRFSSISKSHKTLPFKIQLNIKSSLSEIVDEASLYTDEDYYNPNTNLLNLYVSDSDYESDCIDNVKRTPTQK